MTGLGAPESLILHQLVELLAADLRLFLGCNDGRGYPGFDRPIAERRLAIVRDKEPLHFVAGDVQGDVEVFRMTVFDQKHITFGARQIVLTTDLAEIGVALLFVAGRARGGCPDVFEDTMRGRGGMSAIASLIWQRLSAIVLAIIATPLGAGAVVAAAFLLWNWTIDNARLRSKATAGGLSAVETAALRAQLGLERKRRDAAEYASSYRYQC